MNVVVRGAGAVRDLLARAGIPHVVPADILREQGKEAGAPNFPRPGGAAPA